MGTQRHQALGMRSGPGPGHFNPAAEATLSGSLPSLTPRCWLSPPTSSDLPGLTGPLRPRRGRAASSRRSTHMAGELEEPGPRAPASPPQHVPAQPGIWTPTVTLTSGEKEQIRMKREVDTAAISPQSPNPSGPPNHLPLLPAPSPQSVLRRRPKLMHSE